MSKVWESYLYELPREDMWAVLRIRLTGFASRSATVHLMMGWGIVKGTFQLTSGQDVCQDIIYCSLGEQLPAATLPRTTSDIQARCHLILKTNSLLKEEIVVVFALSETIMIA